MMKFLRLSTYVSPLAVLLLSVGCPSVRAQTPTAKAAAPTASPAADASSPNQAQEKAAQVAAETWLMLLDDAKYAESWDTASSVFQGAISKEKWTTQLGMVRTAYGKASGRKLKVIKYMTSIPKAPPGEYVVLQYEATFQSKKNAIETITPMLDKDGTWKISGYYIN